MKLRTVVFSTGLAALMLVGCDKHDAANGSGTEAQEPTTAEDVAREASDAVTTAGEFAAGQIDTYKDNARKGLDTIEASIDTLSQRVENLSGGAKVEAQRALDNLRERRDEFVSDLDEATADSAKAWNDVKAGLDRAWNDLESATESAMNRFGPKPSDNEASGDG